MTERHVFMGRVHVLMTGSHGLLDRVHDLMDRVHDLMNRVHDLTNRRRRPIRQRQGHLAGGNLDRACDQRGIDGADVPIPGGNVAIDRRLRHLERGDLLTDRRHDPIAGRHAAISARSGLLGGGEGPLPTPGRLPWWRRRSP